MKNKLLQIMWTDLHFMNPSAFLKIILEHVIEKFSFLINFFNNIFHKEN